MYSICICATKYRPIDSGGVHQSEWNVKPTQNNKEIRNETNHCLMPKYCTILTIGNISLKPKHAQSNYMYQHLYTII